MRATRLWPAGGAGRGIDWPRLARIAAALHLLALALIVAIAWPDEVGAGSAAGGLPALHLVLLVATGGAATLLALRPGEWAASGATQARDATAAIEPRLVAQMGHELRTPLNAVIGFSEVMLRELHGPLGHARYQEYAACISESGERLLRVSEDTLAVAATVSALMADRRAVRRERVPAATLLREAWAAAAAAVPGRHVVLADCGCEIECDWRATGQALEHLLREAITRTPRGGVVEVRGHRRDGISSIEIEVVTGGVATGGQTPRDRPAHDSRSLAARGLTPFTPSLEARSLTPSDTPGDGVRVLLARSLLEMQDAALSLCSDPAGPWRARVAFPATRVRPRDTIAAQPRMTLRRPVVASSMPLPLRSVPLQCVLAPGRSF